MTSPSAGSAELSVPGEKVTVGEAQTSLGNLTLSGKDTVVGIRPQLIIGDQGTGSFRINDGPVVSINSGPNHPTVLGQGEQGDGSITASLPVRNSSMSIVLVVGERHCYTGINETETKSFAVLRKLVNRSRKPFALTNEWSRRIA